MTQVPIMNAAQETGYDCCILNWQEIVINKSNNNSIFKEVLVLEHLFYTENAYKSHQPA